MIRIGMQEFCSPDSKKWKSGWQEFCSLDSKKVEVRMARFLLSGEMKK